MAICHKCLEHSVVFPVDLFWSNLHLIFPPIPFSWNSRVWSFFSSILGIETFFLEGFKVFCVVLMKDKSSQIKNRKLWWQKRVSLMYCFHFFRNQLWRRLISCNSFRNVNMCLLEVAMREKFYFFWRGGVSTPLHAMNCPRTNMSRTILVHLHVIRKPWMEI